MKRDPQQYPDDDGRVICNMNVEGIPRRNRRLRHEQASTRTDSQPAPLTRVEAWRYTWYSVLAGLSVVGVFAMTWVLFILFCTEIWFR
jgi:hypothetical protein